MPTYAYACKQCGHRFDAVQSFTDAALTVCPNCGGGPLRKQYGSIGVTFNGPGFYRTDSRAAAGGADRAGSAGDRGDAGDKGGGSSGDKGGGSGGDAGAATGGASGTAAASSTPAASPGPSSGS